LRFIYNIKDIELLENIKAYFGGKGYIFIKKKFFSVSYKVNYNNLDIIINHFNDYPLITKKQKDFELFQRI
jgi:hypothetical protein